MLDCIDIYIAGPRVDYEKLSDDRLGESSADIRAREKAARERQRFNGQGKVHEDVCGEVLSNADMRPAEVCKFCKLGETSEALMRSAMQQLQLSVRAYHRVLKLARIIADLAGEEKIGPTHLAEAMQDRPKLGMM